MARAFFQVTTAFGLFLKHPVVVCLPHDNNPWLKKNLALLRLVSHIRSFSSVCGMNE